MHRTLARATWIVIGVVLLSCGTLHAQSADAVRRQTAIDTGLAVVIAADIDLAADLADGGRLLVHLLCPRADRLAALRQSAHRRGLGGRLVVCALPAGYLPHPDRFVNLVVADLDALAGRAPKRDELMRILAVRGAAYIGQGSKWRVIRKPPDEGIDGWFSRWYDASGGCVSSDRVAGFPRAVQWQHGPAMEDGTADGKTPLVDRGRMVHLGARDGVLFCRDAGNGMLLWTRRVGIRQNDGLALAAGRVHVWHDAKAQPAADPKGLGERGPIVALDLATGEIAQTYDEGLIAGTAKRIEWEAGGRRRRESPVPWFAVTDEVIAQAYGPDLVLLDRATGRRRWRKTIEGATWFSPTVGGGMVLAAEAVRPARRGRHDEASHARAIVAFDMASGRRRWRLTDFHRVHEIRDKARTYRARAGLKPLSIVGPRVLVQTASYQFREGGGVAVLDAATGGEIWRHRFEPKQRYTSGSYRAVLRGGEVIVMCGITTTRFDAATGRLLGHTGPDRTLRRGVRANGACAASRATVNWLIANSYLYVGPGGEARTFFGARAQCGGCVVPAGGLLLVPPAACDCGDYTRGYQGLAPAVPGRPVADGARLTRGAAAPEGGKLEAGWPMFLGGPQRLSATDEELPAKLAERWRVKAAGVRADRLDADRRLSERHLGALSAPVATGDLVLVAAPESHEVSAFAAADGKRRWTFAAGGKVDSPPTLAGGLAVFGCDDGSVYAVRLADGRMAWRFVAAPTDGVAMHHGHLASAFPLAGSVLVLPDRVVAVAGQHTDVGGLHCWTLELATGRPRARRVIRADQPAVVTNALTAADADGRGFWLGSGAGGSILHLSGDLKDLPAGREGPAPTIVFDRNGTRVRFRTADGRGGSTHSWKQAMRSGPARGHRIARAGGISYVVQDPTSRARHKVNAPKTATLQALGGTWRQKELRWQRTQEELGNPESFSALIKAGGRLVLGGGRRDGSAGFVQLLEVATGKLLSTHALPARVTECGLAAAGGSLYVCCEDGTLVCLAARRGR